MSANRRLTGFSPAVREVIRARASRTHTYGLGHGAVCEILAHCQGAPATEAHHRRSRNMGSTRRPETNLAANGLLICQADHRWITEHPKEAREFGWIVSQYKTPADIPVLYRGKWALLSDAGDLVYIPAPTVRPA